MRRRHFLAAVSSLAILSGVMGTWLAVGCLDSDPAGVLQDAGTDAPDDSETGTGVGDGRSDGGPSDADGDAEAGSRSHGACGGDGDCASGHCVEITPGGYRACGTSPEAPQMCVDGGNEGPFADECCGSCDAGICTLHRSCGPAPFPPYNSCIYDGCGSDGECGDGGVCLPAALEGVRRCLGGNECKSHADCTALAGGQCVPAGLIAPAATCSPYDFACAPRSVGALRCIYTGECAADSECPDGAHCELVDARPKCQDGKRQQCPPPP